MDIIDLMRAGTEARFPVRLRQFEIWLRPLSIVETIQLAAEVAEELSKRPQHARNAITEHVIFSIKTLTAASTSREGAHDPKITEFVLQSVTADELHYLFKEYCAGVDKLNPTLEKLPEGRLQELVEFAKKNDTALIELSFRELVALARYLVTNSPQDSVSGG